MDHINASFELLGAVFVLPSILQAIKQGEIRGVSIWTPAFFWAWGLWNLFYYPHLDQWISTFAGLGVFTANSVWLYLVWKLQKTNNVDPEISSSSQSSSFIQPGDRPA